MSNMPAEHQAQALYKPTNPPWADKKLTRQERGDMAFRYLDWLLTKNVPSGGFRLLYAISQWFTDENPFYCFPSTDRLAEQIGRKQSTVWEMLPKLENIGVIKIEWGSKGSGHPNVYWLPDEFLAFYFGPEKGRRSVPKKYRQAGISKYRPAGISKHRQTGVSSAPEIPVQPSENTGLTPKKYRQAGMNHLLTTYSHKSAPTARSSARVDRGDATETKNTSDDAPQNAAFDTSPDAPISATDRPTARAGDPALKQPADQAQPPPSHPSQDMGRRAANGVASATSPFAQVLSVYPADRVGDEAKAFFAFCDALDAGANLSLILEDLKNLTLEGEDVPDLREALQQIIERGQVRRTSRQ